MALTGSLTLQQYALQSNSPLIQYVAFSLLDVHSVINDIGITTKPTLKANGSRITTLPTPGWRKLSETPAAVTTTASPFQEQAFILSNTIDIDRLLMMDENAVGDPSAVQINAAVKAWSFDFTDKFINNNHVTGDADAFVGIRQRLDDTTSWGTNTACKIDCGGVDLSDSGMTAATANKAIRFIEQMLDEIGEPDGSNCVVYMNRDLRRRLGQAIRLLGAGGGFDMTRDAFGRQLLTYRNATIRALGIKTDQSTEIITSTETSAGANGSSTFTSMYAVKFDDNTFNGWQMEPLRVQSIGQRTDEPTSYRTFIEWAVGLYQVHTRAVARGYDIKVS